MEQDESIAEPSGDGRPVNESAQATAPTLLTATYIHSHDCPWNGQQVVVRPMCQGGVAYLVDPTCIVTTSKLELIDFRTE